MSFKLIMIYMSPCKGFREPGEKGQNAREHRGKNARDQGE